MILEKNHKDIEIFEEHLDQYMKIQKRYPSVRLGGSVGLILCDEMPLRTVGDLDVVSEEDILGNYQELLKRSDEKIGRGSEPFCVKVKLEGDIVDFRMVSNAKYVTIDYKQHKDIKVHLPNFAWEAKLSFILKEHGEMKDSNRKHWADLQHWIKATEHAFNDETR